MDGRRDFWPGLVLSAAALVVVAAVGEVVYSPGGSRFEDEVVGLVLNLRAPWLTAVMRAATLLGDPRFLAAVALACAWARWPSRLAMPVLLLAETMANLALKSWFDRPRPGAEVQPLVEEPFYSYPSGHSMSAFVMYGFMAWLVLGAPWPARTRWAAFTLLGLAVLLVGVSRIYLGAHHPGDVLGGYAAGVPLVWGAIMACGGRRGCSSGPGRAPGP